eukprot:jgi/Astpho2/8522/Aster-x1526
MLHHQALLKEQQRSRSSTEFLACNHCCACYKLSSHLFERFTHLDAADAKVGDLEAPMLVNEDVAGLEVPVDHTGVQDVDVAHANPSLPAVDARMQVVPGHQLHDEAHIGYLFSHTSGRLGENPHQQAALYTDQSLAEAGQGGSATAIQHHSKEPTEVGHADTAMPGGAQCASSAEAGRSILGVTNPGGAHFEAGPQHLYQPVAVEPAAELHLLDEGAVVL